MDDPGIEASKPPRATALAPAAAAVAIPARAILDVRQAAAFARGHLAGAGNLPLSEFEPRRAELPPRERALLVIGADGASAARAAADLVGRGFADVAFVDGAAEDLAGGCASTAAPARLWQPAPFLAQVLPHLPRGRAADLAAGSGREAVFLALHGFEVEAFDVAPEALERAAGLARRNGAALTTTVCDLEAPDPPLGEARFQVIVCFRFLHRPLFPAIERALAPGGHLVYETFRRGQERFGKPRRPAFLLESGELARAFPGLEVLDYREPAPAEGPWTARLLARRSVRA